MRTTTSRALVSIAGQGGELVHGVAVETHLCTAMPREIAGINAGTCRHVTGPQDVQGCTAPDRLARNSQSRGIGGP